MRQTRIPYTSTSDLIRVVNSMLHAHGFITLNSDVKSGQLVAQSLHQRSVSREAYVQVLPMDDKTFGVEVEVRNLGLEILRSRENDRIEIRILRELHRMAFQQKSQPVRLAYSA